MDRWFRSGEGRLQGLGVRESMGGVDKGVVEEPVRSGGQTLPDGRQRFGAAATGKRLGRGEPGPRRAGRQEPDQRLFRPAVGSLGQGPGRSARLPPRPVSKSADRSDGSAGLVRNRRQRPDGIDLPDDGGATQHLSERGDRGGAAADELTAGPLAHDRAGIGLQARKLSRPCRDRQSNREPARVVGLPRPDAPNTVDSAARLRLADAAGRAVVDVPGSGVDDQKAAISVLENVGGMEVGILGRQEVEVLASERRPVRDRGRGGRPAASCAGPRRGSPGTRRGRPYRGSEPVRSGPRPGTGRRAAARRR